MALVINDEILGRDTNGSKCLPRVIFPDCNKSPSLNPDSQQQLSAVCASSKGVETEAWPFWKSHVEKACHRIKTTSHSKNLLAIRIRL